MCRCLPAFSRQNSTSTPTAHGVCLLRASTSLSLRTLGCDGPTSSAFGSTNRPWHTRRHGRGNANTRRGRPARAESRASVGPRPWSRRRTDRATPCVKSARFQSPPQRASTRRMVHALPVEGQHCGLGLRIGEPLAADLLARLPNAVGHVERGIRFPAVRPPDGGHFVDHRRAETGGRPNAAHAPRLDHNGPAVAALRSGLSLCSIA